jgi:hypothetical protein
MPLCVNGTTTRRSVLGTITTAWLVHLMLCHRQQLFQCQNHLQNTPQIDVTDQKYVDTLLW